MFPQNLKNMKTRVILIFMCCAAIVSAAEFKRRIANHGEKAKEKEFPYMASLKYKNKHFCGGSLISKSHVLTAAHCVQDNVDDDICPVKDVSVEVGMIRQGSGQTFKVKRISYHPEFKAIKYQNDIAVVHLAEPVELSEKVSIINLPKTGTLLPPGTQVFLSGFGNDEIHGLASPVLKMMDSEIVSMEACQKDHQSTLVVGNICAAKEKDYGTCEGDSGGPLVDQTKTTLLGVVSGGVIDCKSGKPNVYTEVSRFLPYIQSELNYDPANPGSTSRNPSVTNNYLNDTENSRDVSEFM